MKFSKAALGISAFFLGLSLAGCVATAPVVGQSASGTTQVAKKEWTCEANNLRTSNYSGGSHAYVHLSSYSSGGSYPVVKNGSMAMGTTADGTKFVCKEK